MIKKETKERLKRYKVSSVILMICMPIFFITLFMAVFWRLEFALLVMISGGAATFALDYQYNKERTRPWTKEEIDEWNEFKEDILRGLEVEVNTEADQ